ncbi:hypothetical protein V8E55_009306 [Tylopilus felleus]
MDSQVIVYNLLKKSLGPAPIYVTVGNHDTYIQFQMIPIYDGWISWTAIQLVRSTSALLCRRDIHLTLDCIGCTNISRHYEGWLPEESVEFARSDYAAYTVKRPDGPRIISIDTDMVQVMMTIAALLLSVSDFNNNE